MTKQRYLEDGYYSEDKTGGTMNFGMLRRLFTLKIDGRRPPTVIVPLAMIVEGTMIA